MDFEVVWRKINHKSMILSNPDISRVRFESLVAEQKSCLVRTFFSLAPEFPKYQEASSEGSPRARKKLLFS